MTDRKAKHDLGSGYWKCPACQPTGPGARFDCRVCDGTGMVTSDAYDAFEAMVDTMHPGVGENDTLGAPYSFDRGLLRDFAARLIAAGYARRSDVEAEVDAASNCGPR